MIIHDSMRKTLCRISKNQSPIETVIYRGYYTVARWYEFYVRVAKQYLTSERSERVRYCFCHENIKFISSSQRVMFFLLYRQTLQHWIESTSLEQIVRELLQLARWNFLNISLFFDFVGNSLSSFKSYEVSFFVPAFSSSLLNDFMSA